LQGGAVWLALIGLLNSGLAAAYYLKLAVSVSQTPLASAKPTVTPKLGPAVATALALAVAATLILGIAPSRILGAAGAGARSFPAALPSTITLVR